MIGSRPEATSAAGQHGRTVREAPATQAWPGQHYGQIVAGGVNLGDSESGALWPSARFVLHALAVAA